MTNKQDTMLKICLLEAEEGKVQVCCTALSGLSSLLQNCSQGKAVRRLKPAASSAAKDTKPNPALAPCVSQGRAELQCKQ